MMKTALLKRKDSKTVQLLIAVLLLLVALADILPLLAEREDVTFSSVEMTDGMQAQADRGLYTAVILYGGGSADGRLTLTLYPDTPGAKREREVILPRARNEIQPRVYVPGNDVPVQISLQKNEANPALQLTAVRLVYRRMLSVAARLLHLLLAELILCVLFFLYRRIQRSADPQMPLACVILASAFLLSAMPLWMDGLSYGHDLGIHLKRIAAIADGLEQGVFPVRLQSFWWQDYGYPLGIFYPDLLLYPFAVCYLLGLSLAGSMKLYLLTLHAVTLLLSYYCFRKITGNTLRGALCAVIYSLSMWRLTNFYTRAALGEYTAMTFLPLVILGFFFLLGEEEEKDAKKALWFLVAGFTGLLQSHTLTAMMSAVFAALICLCYAKTMLARKAYALRTVAIAAGITLLLNLHYLVPFFDYYTRYSLMVSQSTVMSTGLGQEVSPLQWLMTDYDASGLSLVITEGMERGMPKTPGYGILLIVPLLLYVLLSRTALRKKKGMILCALLACLAMFMTTAAFPYAFLQEHIPLLFLVLGSTQYTFRYFVAATALFTAALALLLRNLRTSAPVQGKTEADRARFTKRVISGTLLACAIVTAVQGTDYMSEYGRHADRELGFYDVYALGIMDKVEWLYVFDDVNPVAAAEQLETVTSDKAVTVTRLSRRGMTDRLSVTNASEEEAFVELPRWHYEGFYAVTDAGEQVDISDGESRRIRLTVPAHFEGEITVSFAEPSSWRAAELLSLLTFLALIAWPHIRRRIRKKSEDPLPDAV